jgi:chorismate--pyruvate lyase
MLPTRWTSAPPPAIAARPLRRPGSLTARLARSGPVSVDVLFSGWQAADLADARALHLPRAGLRIYVRIVLVRRSLQPAVLARSITTLAGRQGAWRPIHQLGRQPLATLLWGSPGIRRGPFEYARLRGGDRLVRMAGAATGLPARRSCFWQSGQPLVVQEAFLGLPWPSVSWQCPRRDWRAAF